MLPSDQHPAGRAVPRRARRLAAGRALALRHPGARALGAGDQRPAARAVRRRRPGGRLRRRHRDPDPRHRRRAAGRRGRRLRARRDRRSSSPSEVGGSALFASRFRECAARALLLPRRDPGRRSPLWQQRQRSAALLEVAVEVPVVPDRPRGGPRVPPGRLRPARAGRPDARASTGARSRSSTSRPSQPSPFARSLLFGYVAQFVYEGDSPIAERRAAALSLDQGLLAELLGRAELRELLDPEVLAEVEAELQRLAPDRRARDAEGVADLLRLLGPLTDRRGRRPLGRRRRRRRLAERPWPTSRRVVEVRMAGEERWTAIEDVGRLRDGLGVPVPPGTPDAFTEPVDDPLGRPGRPLRPHPRPVHHRRRRDPARPRRGRRPPHPAAARPRRAGCSTASSARPAPGTSGATPRCCASCAAARWPGCARRSSRSSPRRSAASSPRLAARPGRPGGLRGVDGVLTVDRPARRLRRCPASALEPLVLAARVRDYEPSYLDELTASGEVLWAGHARAARRRRLGLAAPRRPGAADPARAPTPFEHTELHQAVLDALAPGGAWFFRQLSDAGRLPPTTGALPPRCGTSSGPAGSATTPSPRCARSPAPARPPTAAAGHRPRSRTTARPAGCRRAPARPRPPAAGRCCPSSTPTRPAARTPPPSGCSTGTAWSSAARWSASGSPGGFAAVYKVLSAFEDSGRCRRGYFVGRPRRRPVRHRRRDRPAAHLRRGRPTTPSRPPSRWPPPTRPTPTAPRCPGRTGERRGRASGHRPGRKAGALVVLVDGELTLYVERGGRTLLTWTDDPDLLDPGRRVAGRGGPPRLARPAHRREGRRRAAARRRARPRCARRSRPPGSSPPRGGCG